MSIICPNEFGGKSCALCNEIRSLIEAHGGEAEQKRTVSRELFETWANNRLFFESRDNTLYARTKFFLHILSELGYAIEEKKP